MGERITISFELEKEDILGIFQESYVAKAFEEFLKKYFSDYIDIHIKNISQNMKAIEKELVEKETQKVAFEYLKSCIEKQDIEKLQIEVAKELFKQSFTCREEPKVAIYKIFEKTTVIALAEIIRGKIRYKYFLSTV